MKRGGGATPLVERNRKKTEQRPQGGRKCVWEGGIFREKEGGGGEAVTGMDRVRVEGKPDRS